MAKRLHADARDLGGFQVQRILPNKAQKWSGLLFFSIT